MSVLSIDHRNAAGAMECAPKSSPAEKFKLRSVVDLRTLPKPAWLIRDLFQVESLVVLYGPSNAGKTFVALDMALCVATGRDYHGHKVKQGNVVYVVSEGGRGISGRIEGWMQENGVTEIPNAFFVLDAVQLTNSDDVNTFLKQIRSHLGTTTPALIVLDTFARSFVGKEENSAKEVGEWVEASRRIQNEMCAAVMAVHHSGKPKDGSPVTERGSSALRAAVESALQVFVKGDIVVLTCDKEKEAKKCNPMEFTKHPTFIGNDDDGEPVMTLVLRRTTTPAVADSELPPSESAALRVLESLGSSGASSGDWRRALGVSDSSFHRVRRGLNERKLVEPVPEKRGWYRVLSTAMTLPDTAMEAVPTPSTATTL